MKSGISVAVFCGISSIAFTVPAQAQTQNFNIPAGDLKVALDIYTSLTGVQLIYRLDDVKGVPSPGARGAFSTSNALRALLSGTGFQENRDSSGAIAIVRRIKVNYEPKQQRSFAPIESADQEATTAAASDIGLEDIVVTAQKRAENLQNTPISMAALTSAGLESKGIADITDLRSVVPALQVTPFPTNALTARVYLRGVGAGDDSPTQDPSVAVYLDGVYVARSQGLAMEVAELERVEVLRGPQGSLYGRNATGGAINYITKAPDLGKFGFKQTLAYGNYDQFRSRTRINVPVGDTLAVELSYLHSQKDGYVKNLGTGVERFGDQRRDAYRAAVRWAPIDTVDVRYTYDRSDIEDTPQFVARVPLYPRKANRPSAGSPFAQNVLPNDATAQGHNLTASWDVADELTLKSITAYRKLHNFAYQSNFAGQLGPRDGVISTLDLDQNQFTQELQAIGKALDGRLEYVLGAYYFDESGDSFDTSHPPSGVAVGLDRTIAIDNTAYALYGQTTFRPAFLDGLYVTGGLRWSRDKRKAVLDQVILPIVGAPFPVSGGEGERKFSNVSPSLIVGYNVSDDVNLYAKWARGYKSGGYNVRASTIARFEEGFDQEGLDSYEMGLKSSWLDNRLRFNVAGFVSKYKDIVVNLQVDPSRPAVTDALNAGRATIKGVELDLTARPTPGLTVGMSYAYLDAQYDRITDPTTSNNIAGRFNFAEAPKHTVTTSLQYQFPETPIGTVTAYIDYFMQSRKFTVANDPRFIIGDYGLLDARLTLADIPIGMGKWRLSAFGKNLTDKEYYVTHYQGFVPAAVFGQPRTYGLELTFEY